MEEVDKIIFHSLKEIGCDIDDDILSLKQFTPELVIEAASHCLHIISESQFDSQPFLKSKALPANMSARFRIGTDIAKACSELGYPGEVGYQTFLYPTESELRKIFIFLIEKLPKETEKGSAETDDGAPNLRAAISEAVRSKLSVPWVKSRSAGSATPFISLPIETGISLPGEKRDCTPQEWREYCVKHLPFIHEQLSVRDLLVPSLLVENSRCLLSQSSFPNTSSQTMLSSPSWSSLSSQQIDKTLPLVPEENSLFTLREKFQHRHPKQNWDTKANVQKATETIPNMPSSELDPNEKVDISVKTEEEKKEEENRELERYKETIEDLNSSIKTISTKLQQVEKEAVKLEENVKSHEKEEEIRQKTLSLLPESNENMIKLQEMVDASVQKLKTLAEQWEKHRVPLIMKYRELRQRVTNKASENMRQQETVRELRSRFGDINEQVSAKESMLSRLQEEVDKLPKDIVTRPAYTRRILEIIGNIKKQCEVINNIVSDIKQLQKDINMETGKLERSFTVANELIFKDARDETARKAYKMLALLHSDFAEVVDMVEETGAILREISDLEEQVEIEMAKNTAGNLERINADLQEMRKETSISSKSNLASSS